MKRKLSLILLFSVLLFGCGSKKKTVDLTKSKVQYSKDDFSVSDASKRTNDIQVKNIKKVDSADRHRVTTEEWGFDTAGRAISYRKTTEEREKAGSESEENSVRSIGTDSLSSSQITTKVDSVAKVEEKKKDIDKKSASQFVPWALLICFVAGAFIAYRLRP